MSTETEVTLYTVNYAKTFPDVSTVIVYDSRDLFILEFFKRKK